MQLSTALLLWATCTLSTISASEISGDQYTRPIWIDDCDVDAEFHVECREQTYYGLWCSSFSHRSSGDGHSVCGEGEWQNFGRIDLHRNETRVVTIEKAGAEPNRVRDGSATSRLTAQLQCSLRVWDWDEDDYIITWNYGGNTFHVKTTDLTLRKGSEAKMEIVCDFRP